MAGNESGHHSEELVRYDQKLGAAFERNAVFPAEIAQILEMSTLVMLLGQCRPAARNA